MTVKKHDILERKSFKFSVDSFDEEAGIFTGYASVFGGVDSYGDTIVPGAFKKTLRLHKDGKFPLTWNHSQMEPLGVVYLDEDDKGLRVKRGELNMDVQSAREKRSLIKQGAVTGQSIGFRAVKQKPNKDGLGRQLEEIALAEVALCLFPADEAAQIAEVKTAGYESLEEFLEATGPWLDQKPYPNEHACRLQDPGKFDKFRRGIRDHEGKEYSIIFGHVKGGEEWEEQAYRYDKDKWTAAEARAHCAAHKGTFEAAEKCEDCNFDDTAPGTRPGLKDKSEERIARSLQALNDELKRFIAIP
jgi:HK97 family phage prohead protease